MARHARQLRRAVELLEGELRILHRQHDRADEALRILLMNRRARVVHRL